MDDIEHLIRVTLDDRAASVGAPVGLARAARGRARRGLRRAHAAGVAAAAAAVLLAVPAGAQLRSPAPTSTLDAGAPAPTVPAVPPFPFSPAVAPPGYGEPVAELSAGVPGLRYDAGGSGRWLTVTITAERPTEAGWEERKTTVAPVHGRKGWLEVGPGGRALTWQADGDRWLRVAADPGLDQKDLIRFAEGLRPGEVPVSWPFAFETVPPGLVPDMVSRAAVTFRPEGAAPSHDFGGRLAVMLSDAATGPPRGGRRLSVAGRAGRLTVESGVTVLSVGIGGGRLLIVQADAALGLDEAERVAFASGVRATPDAVFGQG